MPPFRARREYRVPRFRQKGSVCVPEEGTPPSSYPEYFVVRERSARTYALQHVQKRLSRDHVDDLEPPLAKLEDHPMMDPDSGHVDR